MSLWNWFTGLFSENGTLQLDANITDLASEVVYQELAVRSCINLIANAVARSDFVTFEKGEKVRKDNYYLFNVEPNKNKSASKFWRDVITRLVYDNECLVIQRKDSFYVAENYTLEKFAFLEYRYSDVVIDGYKLNRKYRESEVFHFELNDQKIRSVINGVYSSYSKLIAASQSHYKKNNSRRGALEIPASYPQTDKAKEKLQNLLGESFERFFNAEGGAVIPLTNGVKYKELSSNVGGKGGTEGRDIRQFIDDVFDFVAIAFQVPPKLLKGEISQTDDVVNNFITFRVNPLAELITDEVNRKYYGKDAFLERTYMKLDTTRIKNVDITDIAGSLDILTRIGAYTIDDCLKELGMEPLETDFSQARYMTKNYEEIK